HTRSKRDWSSDVCSSDLDELMSIAYDNGINFFDNAEVYALGESEKMMGRVLKKKEWDRTSYIVSSKVFFGWRGKNNKPNQTGLRSEERRVGKERRYK